MWMIICEYGDDSALSLATLLQREDIKHVVILPEDLVSATHIHRLGSDGSTARFTLGNGTECELARVRLLVNRLSDVPGSYLNRCADADREYVRSEWSALFSSLLTCCGGPVLNPPLGDSLSPPLNDLECIHYAARCGLPIVSRLVNDQTESWLNPQPLPYSSHLVVGGAVLPELPETLTLGVLRLADLLGLPLLQVDFAVDSSGKPVFAGCTSQVEFRHAPGPELVGALRRIADWQVTT